MLHIQFSYYGQEFNLH